MGIALSSACSLTDVITPLGADEKIRKDLNYPSPRFFIPWWNLGKYGIVRTKRKLHLLQQSYSSELKKIGLHTHISLQEARDKRYLDSNKISSYFSFCFVRNPWDLCLSRFYWINRKRSSSEHDLNDYLFHPKLEKAARMERNLYMLDGHIAVNRFCRYEHLQDEVHRLFQDLNLPGNPSLPKSKTGTRMDRRHYRDLLTDLQAERIAQVYRFEIDKFGYSY